MLIKTEGIVLKTLDYGEGNKILTVFTKEMGKVGMMARGARKTKSRLGAVSQPFILGHFIFQTGSGLATLNQGEIINAYPHIRQDLYQTAFTTYILELVDRFTEDKQRSGIIYRLLYEALRNMEEGKDPEILARIFELKILSINGYKPVLNACSSCKEGLSPWLFSVREGGLLCYGCRHKDPHALPLQEGIPRLLHLFQKIDLANLGQIKVKESTKQQLEQIMHLFMDEHVGVRLKSKRFLEQLRKLEKNVLRKELEDGKGADS